MRLAHLVLNTSDWPFYSCSILLWCSQMISLRLMLLLFHICTNTPSYFFFFFVLGRLDLTPALFLKKKEKDFRWFSWFTGILPWDSDMRLLLWIQFFWPRVCSFTAKIHRTGFIHPNQPWSCFGDMQISFFCPFAVSLSKLSLASVSAIEELNPNLRICVENWTNTVQVFDIGDQCTCSYPGCTIDICHLRNRVNSQEQAANSSTKHNM